MSCPTPAYARSTYSSLALPSAVLRRGSNIWQRTRISFSRFERGLLLRAGSANSGSSTPKRSIGSSSGIAAMPRSSERHRPCTYSPKQPPRASGDTIRTRKSLSSSGTEEYLPSLHNKFLWEFSEEIEDFETVWRLSGRRPPETVPKTCLRAKNVGLRGDGSPFMSRLSAIWPRFRQSE